MMYYDTNDEIATALRNLMYASQMIILKTPRNDVNLGPRNDGNLVPGNLTIAEQV